MAIDINAWTTLKDRWAADEERDEMRSTTVLFLQEHPITSQDDCKDAVEWCD